METVMETLPAHLRKYIVEQDQDKYTPVDHAAWRFILRQLRAYLSKHAHESYLSGLEKTGISIERIPRISEISEKLSQFGWRALPVSGFIPPAAFMELQSLSVLPIASDMRSISHLMYTPAPDIVHEAAGHAPLLAHPEYAQYLKEYAAVARKAILSKEDLDIYAAIRVLSDLKESPDSTPEQIRQAEQDLERKTKSTRFVSEGAQLSRMNWWTAEYGLIGPLENPKIFGAGLLSSVGESRWCLSPKVKKIPLSLDCVRFSYDITEPQPQLFVTPDFQHLTAVLNEFADTMAFRRGGLEGLEKAQQAETVNSVELETGLQVSGRLVEVLRDDLGQPCYLRFEGPSQLAFSEQELPGHDKSYHAHGYGTALGRLRDFPQHDLGDLSLAQWESLGLREGQGVSLNFLSGVSVIGRVRSVLSKEGKILLVTLENATARKGDRVLFDPSWGLYDLALGSRAVSVFGGPADRQAYGETDDFVAMRVPAHTWSDSEKALHRLYAQVRELRESKVQGPNLQTALGEILSERERRHPQDWLLLMEIHELALNRLPQSDLVSMTRQQLEAFVKKEPQMGDLISDGLALASQM